MSPMKVSRAERERARERERERRLTKVDANGALKEPEEPQQHTGWPQSAWAPLEAWLGGATGKVSTAAAAAAAAPAKVNSLNLIA